MEAERATVLLAIAIACVYFCRHAGLVVGKEHLVSTSTLSGADGTFVVNLDHS